MLVLLEIIHRSMPMLLREHALAVILCVIFFEELGVPSPIPGDLMMVLAGVRVAQGREPLWLVLLLQEVVTVLGASGLFYLSQRCGRPLVLKYGRFIHLGPKNLARAEEKITRHGAWAIVIGRNLPGLRIITPIAAGVLGMPYRVFGPALALGAFIYILCYTLLGVFVGPAALAIFDRISLPADAILSLIALALIVFVIRQLRRIAPTFTMDRHVAVTASLVAGVMAGVTGLLAANTLNGFVTFGRRLFGHQPVTVTRGVGNGLRFLIGWPAFLIFAAIIALLAYAVGVGRFSRVPALLLCAGVPLVISLVVLYPLTEARHVGVAEYREQVILAVDAVRWIGYGIALTAFLPHLPHLGRAVPELPPERSSSGTSGTRASRAAESD